YSVPRATYPQYSSALRSAWMVRLQCPFSMAHPASVQWGAPGGDPLYPIAAMRLRGSTTTAPMLARGQVALAAAARAMPMKYSSQSGLLAVILLPLPDSRLLSG